MGCKGKAILANIDSVICLIATLAITARAKSEFVAPWMLIVFSILYPFYLVLAATIGLSPFLA